eukprot:205262_1
MQLPMATRFIVRHKCTAKIYTHRYRNSFFHAYDKERLRRPSPGSVFRPLTWKPRWRFQAGLFALCCAFPWVLAFHHGRIPFFDKLVEKVVCNVWHFEDKDNFDTFEKLPPVKTMYDRELSALKETYDVDTRAEFVPHMSPKDFAKPIPGGLPIIRNKTE